MDTVAQMKKKTTTKTKNAKKLKLTKERVRSLNDVGGDKLAAVGGGLATPCGRSTHPTI